MNSLRKKVAIDQVLNHINSISPSLRSNNNLDARVLVRVDFNVPIQNDQVTDTRRITESIPTIKKLLDSGTNLSFVLKNKGAKNIVLMSHMGRPDGKKNKKYSLKPVAPILERLIGKKVTFLEDCIGPQIESACQGGQGGQIFLLENLRFHAEEEGSFKDEKGNKAIFLIKYESSR
jgi:phosphoglycerate kinase